MSKEVKRHQTFDLDVHSEKQAAELISHLTVLKNTAGWLMLKQILEGNMAVLEQAIISKRDPETGEALTESQIDELRFKRNYLEELAEKPDRLIATFERQAGVSVPSYDPYGATLGKSDEEFARTLIDE